MNRRWPSAKTISKARVDLPEPDTPVTTVSSRCGMLSEIFFRLFSRAPVTVSARGRGPELAEGSAEPSATAFDALGPEA